jgi:hypothetical protein
MKISKDQLKQIIKEEMAAMLNESPSLFSQHSGLGQAAAQTSALASPTSQARELSRSTRDIASDIGALPDSKMIKIEKVFNAEGDALAPSMGANITAHTIRLLGDRAATAAAERGDPIDVTLDMDGKVIGAQVAKKLGGPGTA